MAEVGIAQLRGSLKEWLDRVQSGAEVVITDRGRPIARLTPIDVAPLLERLADEGRISRVPDRHRPAADEIPRVRPTAAVSDLVTRERDGRR